MQDTIVALSSAPPDGSGLRAILRLSGPQAHNLAKTVIQDTPTAKITLVQLTPTPLPAMLLLFHAPHSYTGQHIAELHIPAAAPLVRTLLDRLIAAGARQALAGEFTARAFFHGKFDLTQAEGIAATIAAQNNTELQAAAALREGLLHRKVAELADSVANILAQVEASIDFSDESDVSFITAHTTSNTLQQLREDIDRLLLTAVRVDRLTALPTVVFIGKPNVGKSSLLNALTGQDRSIVSPVAGTTRDMLTAILHTPTGDVRLVDVPGDETPSGEITGKMMDARRLALLEADLVIHVVDPTHHPIASDDSENLPANLIIIQNKADLLKPHQFVEGSWLPNTGQPAGHVSAITGLNIPRLRQLIARLTRRDHSIAAGQMVLNQRHRLILQDVKLTLWHCTQFAHNDPALQQSLDLLAADLRHALDLLGQISGTISPDDVLGRIFGQFCIGK